ncbi:Pimeloyl-ACP methyl ester carboxylesterase [Zobellia uliginosa]|uniref:Pimeloyl-ACP methyl ester carboxylesterase n=1 Tax=Zobellia uliginosa TaxID=143224 RepID=A0ABY1KJY7_9FLAO|nr:alpha/beta hydrolase [Zobellia uliginosa]SIS43122.1 Pimeloyl-ACP methyl ester carboxylesterase [Zobellia uliginosa]
MKALFKTEIGKREILDLYDQKLEELNIEFTYLNIDTGFGKTNIIATGESTNPPIVLIHGSNGCAPIALETYPNLRKNFRVYAVDVVAQPNKSEDKWLSMKDDSYGRWVNEIISSLGLEKVTLVGFSLGGLIILKTLEFDESKVKQVYLAAPAYIVNGNPLKTLFKIFIPMKRFMRTQKVKYIEKFLKELFTERDEFAMRYLSKVFLHFKMDFTPVPVINKSRANSIQTPITLFAAQDDILFPGIKMIKRAKEIFPSLKSAQIFEYSKHVQSKAQNQIIEKAILAD